MKNARQIVDNTRKLIRDLDIGYYVTNRNKTERSRVLNDRVLWFLAAYTYEIDCRSIIDDGTFDKLALQVHKDRTFITGNDKYDTFFQNIDPSTGKQVYHHPDFDIIVKIKYMLEIISIYLSKSCK
jgi:hypothetical protein